MVLKDEKATLTPELMKERGNESFNKGDYYDSIDFYTKAIELSASDSKDLATYYKNRAAAHLKLNNHDDVLKDCDESLRLVPTDPKALFRRALALEHLQRFEESYRDLRASLQSDPSNKALQPHLERLHHIVQKRAQENAQTSNRIEQMYGIAFKYEEPTDKRVKAIQNLLVVAKEKIGAELLHKTGVIDRIQRLLKVEKNVEIRLTAIRIIGQLVKGSEQRTISIVQHLGIPWIVETLNADHVEIVNAAQYSIQVMLNSLAGIDGIDGKCDKKLMEQNNEHIDALLNALCQSVSNRTLSGIARDSILELITKNADYRMLDWAERVIDKGHLWRLLEIASELKEFRYESCMNITDSTKSIVAVCLSRIYENMYYDLLKERFMKQVDDYVKDKLLTPEHEAKVRATVLITVLLQGPTDVGSSIIARDGILEMILVMANSDDVLQQKVACECIIAAGSKKDKAKSIVKEGADILKRLFNSKDDAIRIRALVGLCKVGSLGGTDASIRPFADGASLKLFEACRRFLTSKKEYEVKRWAAEGLAYLTLDAEVKEKLIESPDVIESLIALAKTGNQDALFGVVTTLVNVCNAYDAEEVLPEMLELAKFAKQHVPEKHDLDDEDFVAKRIDVLGRAGITTALVALSKTESKSSKELISRIFNAICAHSELRGLVVQQGGAKVLLPMALNGTEKGQRQAAQALARIGITMNPEVAFPGQRMLEVVRPLLNLLHVDCSALENFEALMALCNLATVSETVRQRIIKEKGLSKIEIYIYDDHDMLRRASVQAMTNLLFSEDVLKMFEGQNDKAKYFYLLCLDEDDETAKAAAAACAIFTSSVKCCKKLFETDKWLEVVQCLLAHPNVEIQYRGAFTVNNLMGSCKEVAEKLIDTNVMEVLMALKMAGQTDERVRDYAGRALDAAKRWDLISGSVDGATAVDT